MSDHETDPLRGLPPDLARVLRDPSILVPQDAGVFELAAGWMLAPTATASALTADEWRDAWTFSTRRWRETEEQRDALAADLDAARQREKAAERELLSLRESLERQVETVLNWQAAYTREREQRTADEESNERVRMEYLAAARSAVQRATDAERKAALYDMAADAFNTGDIDVMEEALGRGAVLASTVQAPEEPTT